MALVYQASVKSITPASGGALHADVFVNYRAGTIADPQWTLVNNGHVTIVIDADEIIGIYNSVALTTIQKRAALRDIIKTKALALAIDKTDEAYIDYTTLLPTFPDDIVIR